MGDHGRDHLAFQEYLAKFRAKGELTSESRLLQLGCVQDLFMSALGSLLQIIDSPSVAPDENLVLSRSWNWVMSECFVTAEAGSVRDPVFSVRSVVPSTEPGFS